MPIVRIDGADHEIQAGETVLDALLRQGVEIPYSCRSGVCFTCLMQATEGTVPPAAQEGLKPTQIELGFMLPCRGLPEDDLTLVRPDEAALYGRAEVTAVESLAPTVTRVRLRPATPLYYRAGQFINLRRNGLVRSYSLASVPRLDDELEIHVKCLGGGQMSGWIRDGLKPGEGIDFQGPNGTCFYMPGRPDQPLLMIGTGTGLAPLLGVLRDALADGHRGPIHLYHGSNTADGLYLAAMLRDLVETHENVTYIPCVSGEPPKEGVRAGRADAAALADHGDISGWRVFLCGAPPMVHGVRKKVYLAGAAMADILADPFELKELRHTPRPPLGPA